MAVDQTTLSEEIVPSPDVLRLLEGLDTGEFYIPDESPYAGDWTDFGRIRRDRQRRKKFQEFDRSTGGPSAMPPEGFNLSELLPFGGFDKAVNRRDPLGIGFELASGVVPGGKAGIMGLAAIKNNPKYAEIIYEMPKSVWKKMKTPLKSRILRDEGKAAFSYSDPAFAQKNYLEPVIGKTQAAKYKYTITHEGKHYFKHKNNESIKSVNSADPRIKENLRLPYKDDKSVLARRQDDVKKADLMKVRKQRLQTEHAADDLHQLRDTTLPPEVRAVTLERYKEYPEAVKREAMKILDDVGGPAGGAGAGLPSLIGHQRYHNYGWWEDIPLDYRTGNSRLTERFLQHHGFEEMINESGRAAAAKQGTLGSAMYEVMGDGKVIVYQIVDKTMTGKNKVMQKTFNDPTFQDLLTYFGY